MNNYQITIQVNQESDLRIYEVIANSDLEAMYKAENLLNRQMIGQGAYSSKIVYITDLNKYNQFK
jgi:hypothetical protein